MDSVISGGSFKGSKLNAYTVKKYHGQANRLIMLVHACRRVRKQEVMSQVVPTVDGRLFGKLILDIAYGVTKYNSPLFTFLWSHAFFWVISIWREY